MFRTFQISLTNFFKTRLLLCEQAHVQFSEIARLPFYEYEMTLELYEEILKEREEERKKREEEQSQGGTLSNGNYEKQARDLMRNARSSFQMPSMPNIPMPKI